LAGVPAKIRIEDFTNTSVEYYRYATLSGQRGGKEKKWKKEEAVRVEQENTK
jgi:hypothetical protein